jgi:hypothetical protein
MKGHRSMHSEVRKAGRAFLRDVAVNGMDPAKAREKYEDRLRAVAARFGVDVQVVREGSPSGGV